MSSLPSASMEAVDRVNLDKIESYFNTSSYRESLEVSATFNSRLSLERRLRLPFLDPQTGVAQRHCALYVKAKQRMPGLRSGQIYTFPAARWRKTKRQYLTNMMIDVQSAVNQHTTAHHNQQQQCNALFNGSSSSSGIGSVLGSGGGGSMSGGFLLSQHDDNSNSNASFLLDKTPTTTTTTTTAGVMDALEMFADNTSRDTNNNSKDELSKDWLYDDLDNDFDSEPKSPDDEFDYDPRYGTKKKKRVTKKEGKGKKASAFGFDFGESRSTGTGGTAKTRRTKEPGTPKRSAAADGGVGGAAVSERRTRRKGAGAKSKKFVEPPSFESAAAGFDDQFSGGGGGGSGAAGWM